MPRAFHVAVAAFVAWSIFSVLPVLSAWAIMGMSADTIERTLPIFVSSNLLSKDPMVAVDTMMVIMLVATMTSLILLASGIIVFVFYAPSSKSTRLGIQYAYAEGDGIHNYERKKFKDVINPHNVTECLVCRCEFDLEEDAVRLHCGHIFHPRGCLAPWIRQNPRCPLLCNYELDSEIVEQIQM